MKPDYFHDSLWDLNAGRDTRYCSNMFVIRYWGPPLISYPEISLKSEIFPVGDLGTRLVHPFFPHYLPVGKHAHTG